MLPADKTLPVNKFGNNKAVSIPSGTGVRTDATLDTVPLTYEEEESSRNIPLPARLVRSLPRLSIFFILFFLFVVPLPPPEPLTAEGVKTTTKKQSTNQTQSNIINRNTLNRILSLCQE